METKKKLNILNRYGLSTPLLCSVSRDHLPLVPRMVTESDIDHVYLYCLNCSYSFEPGLLFYQELQRRLDTDPLV